MYHDAWIAVFGVATDAGIYNHHRIDAECFVHFTDAHKENLVGMTLPSGELNSNVFDCLEPQHFLVKVEGDDPKTFNFNVGTQF